MQSCEFPSVHALPRICAEFLFDDHDFYALHTISCDKVYHFYSGVEMDLPFS